MDADSGHKVQVYMKLIDYKRSIGITQWTVLSIFVTASEAVFLFALTRGETIAKHILPVFAIMVYWLGFLLYRRYRRFNRQVSGYLVKLEEEIGMGFQKHLEERFHERKGLSTERILLVAGIGYSTLAAIVVVLKALGVM